MSKGPQPPSTTATPAPPASPGRPCSSDLHSLASGCCWPRAPSSARAAPSSRSAQDRRCSVVVGTPQLPTRIGRRSTFGHRCLVIGATVGDLCEVGNASTLMPGSTLGDRVFLGEGTLVPAGMHLPSDVVAVGRPARVIRAVSPADLERLRGLRDGDLSIPPHTATDIGPRTEGLNVGQLYQYRGITPTLADSAVLFPTAEITGDVVIGERSIVGAGVKIIGDSRGPVRIGSDVPEITSETTHQYLRRSPPNLS